MIRACKMCKLRFETKNPKQKICRREKCKKEFIRLYGQLWRLGHPNYHTEYMRKYRRKTPMPQVLKDADLFYLRGDWDNAGQLYTRYLENVSQNEGPLNQGEQQRRAKAKQRLKIIYHEGG